MRSICLFHVLIIVHIYIHCVLSYRNQKVHLQDLIQASIRTKYNSPIASIRRTLDSSLPLLNQPLNSAEDEENFQAREAWDSGEDYYFQWATKNRRPVEYFAGRKRDNGKVPVPTRRRYDHDGLWRSGLVG